MKLFMPFPRIALFLCGCVAFLNLYATQGLLGELAVTFHISLRQASWSITVTTLAVAICAPLVGRLTVGMAQHRVIALAALGLGGLLALVTAGPDLRLGAFHRCLTGTGLDTKALLDTWRQAGFQVTDPVPAAPPDTPGTMVVLTRERAFAVHFPQLLDAEGNLRLDHETLELAMLNTSLHLQPGGGSLQPLPTAQFDGTVPESADALFLMAPVPLEHMVRLYRQGRRMPRKSTYFTPKPHGGILLAALV